MAGKSVIIIVGLLITGAIIIIGLIMFPNDHAEFAMNLMAEAAGVVAGGLVLFALVEVYLEFRKRREWTRVRDEIFDRIYWEIEILQFALQPMASWQVGNTLGEDLKQLAEIAGDGPLEAAYFIRHVDALRTPLDSLIKNVTPRVVALADDERLTHHLLNLEESGMKLEIARYSLSEESPATSQQRKLINELLERGAAVVNYIDSKQFNNDSQKAAQARFDRLSDFRLGSSWSSLSREMKLSDGSLYTPGTLPDIN